MLYWDFIDCIFELGRVDEIIPAADFQLLRSEGVLRATSGNLICTNADGTGSFSLPVQMPFEYLLLAQVYALKRYRTLAPSERWSLGQIGQLPNTWAPEVSKYAFFPRELWGMKPENMVELARDEIESRADDLEFKRKRWDELLCFRHALDELFDRAKHFQDQQAAVEYAVDEIGIALRDISRAMGEKISRRLFSTVKVELSLNDVVTGALGGRNYWIRIWTSSTWSYVGCCHSGHSNQLGFLVAAAEKHSYRLQRLRVSVPRCCPIRGR